MELGLPNTLLAGDSRLIDHIVGEVKSQGIFDQFRKECIADVDTKPAYQNLRTRVEGSVNSFLSKQTWKPDLNKNQLRETLRKHIHDEPYLDAGVERIVDQVVNPKVYSVFMSQIEDVVYKFLGMERPKARENNGACGLKDLLPKDLDPVSPESDKNSLKDVSLESVENDIFEERREDRTYDEQRGEEARQDRSKDAPENGHLSSDERTDEAGRAPRIGSNSNLNTSGRSNDKDEEEEEVSPTFEPIDIMNLNECNISNDSHLSGISELTSHRSRSPDFSNDLSRDNFDCSNQDSQLSKVSSDSRLSIVTDFGSSNHGLTPAHDSSKEETKDKCEAKSKDNFKAIREESSKSKTSRSSFDFGKSKDAQDYKESRDFKSTKSTSSKESSRDASDSGIKDKYEHKSSKERSKDNESVKSSKSTKEKVSSKEKYNRDKNNERRKSSSHSGTKHDKHGRSRPKDKVDQARENSDRSRDVSESCKDSAVKVKEEKEVDKRDSVNKDKKESASKEVKDLKDLYKEKIRELREKKELTEKEKLNKDRETKLTKESSKDKKDSLKDKKPSKKEHRSSSSSSSSKVASAGHHESKTGKPDKTADGKDKKSDSRDKAKRDEKRLSKDGKSKAHCSKTDLSEKPDKSDSRKPSKSEKDDKSGKADVKRDARVSGEKTANGRRDAKNHVHQRSKSSDRGERSDSRRDSKSDGSSKDKKRKEEKKSKTKDDHSSLRKNSYDRRSSDRDGSNGSNNKTSPASSSCSNVTGHKSGTSGLTKESVVSNSSSETSDSIEEVQLNESKSSSSHQSNCKVSHSQIGSQLTTCDRNHPKPEINSAEEIPDRPGAKKEEEETAATVTATADLCETDVFARKRSLPDSESAPDDVRIKKPKFAKNIHEAKKLMKLRRQMERQKSRESRPAEKTVAQEAAEQPSQPTRDGDNLEDVPDDERVQIIEIPDEEYEEPYPEKHEPSLKLDESSMMMLGTESCANDFLNKRPDQKPMLSSMELRIKESLCEIVTSMPPEEAQKSSALGAEVARSHSPPGRCSASSARPEDTRETRENGSGDKSKDAISKDITAADEEHGSRTERTHVSETIDIADPEDKNVQQLTEGNAKTQDRNARGDAEEARTDSRPESTRVDNRSQSEKDEVSRVGTADSARVSSSGEDHEDCRYFKTDNEQSEKFSSFLETVEELENSSLEDIIESLGGRVVVTSVPRPMAAPPPTLHERSSALLSNILANNNNDRLKRTLSSSLNEDAVHAAKRRKFAKKPRFSSACNAQGIPNGENFVMPLSPDSDVSATSEKTASSAVIKEEKSRNRSSHQRYSSDDLYKPRPLFSSSSRRSRRTNQA